MANQSINLFPTPKYQLEAVAVVASGDEILLALEILKTACHSAGQKKLTPYFYAKERGVPEDRVHDCIQLLASEELITAEEIATPKGTISYKLALTGSGVRLFASAKAEAQRSFAEYLASKGN